MNVFKYDYFRMYGNQQKHIWAKLKNIIFNHNLRFLYWLRKAESGRFLGKLQCYRYSRKYGLEISPNAKIGKGLYLGHPYNITVGSNCVIGDNVNLHKGCTIGTSIGHKEIGSPIIGNQVFVGINAIIVGKIVIGDDVVIAPGAFVNFDVPSHSIVVGNPGSIHHKEGAANGYINNKV